MRLHIILIDTRSNDTKCIDLGRRRKASRRKDMADNDKTLSLATLQRMPGYLRYLKQREAEGAEYISSVGLAEAMQENPSVVKKDLSMAVVSEGKPKVGYYIPDLVRDIESFMGYDNEKNAVLVGTGKLGQALLGYVGFEKYGLNIVAGFDTDPSLIGKEVHGKKILSADKLKDAVRKLKVKMAVLTLPASQAQKTADILVDAGVRAIWNFSPVGLNLPDTVAVKNENMAASLAVLSAKLKEILKKEENN